MKWNIVSVAAFNERDTVFGRLDAEFVDPDLLRTEEVLTKKFGSQPLSKLPILPVSALPAVNAGDKLVPYIAIDDIDTLDGFVFHQEVPFEELPSRAKFQLQPFDIVVSNVRPERGGVGILISTQQGCAGSSGLTVLRLASKQQRNVLFAYLRTPVARSQLIRRSRGSMYPAVTKDDVAEILVPKFGNKASNDIEALVDLSLAERERFAENRLKQAAFVEGYLKKAFGLPPPDIVLDIAGPLSVHIATFPEFFDLTVR